MLEWIKLVAELDFHSRPLTSSAMARFSLSPLRSEAATFSGSQRPTLGLSAVDLTRPRLSNHLRA